MTAAEQTPEAESEFLHLWKAAKDGLPTPGPSLGFLLAAYLRYAGIALPRAAEPDPYGRDARGRAQLALQWHRG